MDSLKKEVDIHDKVLDVKIIKNYLKRGCALFEMALQHKSKKHMNKDLKQEDGFEKDLEYVKRVSSRLPFKFD